MSIKKTKRYKEACPKKQPEFALELQKYSYELLVFIDETGIVHDTYKDKGWSKKGEQLVEYVTGKSFLRTNIIAGLCNNIPIAPMIFTGSCNTAVFHTWIKEVLIKELKPNQVVIMDNASFHKSLKTKELIESVKCKVLFLPPYSPELNPIETFWANLKNHLKKN